MRAFVSPHAAYPGYGPNVSEHLLCTAEKHIYKPISATPSPPHRRADVTCVSCVFTKCGCMMGHIISSLVDVCVCVFFVCVVKDRVFDAQSTFYGKPLVGYRLAHAK